MKKKVQRIWLYIWIVFFGMFPIKKNKIVFSSFRGKQYSDSPKAISEAISRFGDVEIVWVANKSVDMPANIKKVNPFSLQEAFELATSGIWVDNCRKDSWVRKRKKQYYIQTWHGNIAGKRVEGDSLDSLSMHYIKSAQKDSKMIDLFLSGSKWATNNIKTAFWYSGVIEETGYPRSDIFYKDEFEIKQKVFETYKFDCKTKIALYAPTFRTNHSTECYDLNYPELLKQLEKEWGGNWKIIVRFHPNVAYKKGLVSYSTDILDGLLYQDINELIVASDLLITDYSSCMFDAMEAGKPVMIYASDREEYDKDRGHYFSFEELPFLVAENNDTMKTNISSFDMGRYKTLVKQFMSKCGFVNNGNSADRVANIIMGIIKKGD